MKVDACCVFPFFRFHFGAFRIYLLSPFLSLLRVVVEETHGLFAEWHLGPGTNQIAREGKNIDGSSFLLATERVSGG